jgi:hypothetical protein
MSLAGEIATKGIAVSDLSEKQFSQQVTDAAKTFGWLVYRTWNSQHSPAGFPDLCMVRLSRIIFAELKSEKGKVSPAQQEWLNALSGHGYHIETYLWRPSQFEDEIVRILR